MEWKIALPETTASLIEQTPLRERNVGLQLDKFCALMPSDFYRSFDKSKFGETQKKAMVDVAKAASDNAVERYFAALSQQWQDTLQRLLQTRDGRFFRGRTIGPMTLHLSRATAMENTGICLHPIHGFVFLPGTGLKGLARAFAETIWHPGDKDRRELINRVFGTTKDKQGKTEDHCGEVIFHDAWPAAKPPALFVDIVNCHHTKWYQGNGDLNPPADWEDPNMVSFLSARPGAEFIFYLTARRRETDPALLDLAVEWLIGGLTWLGAGAKTNAGYGSFEILDHQAVPAAVADSGLIRIELDTPAFISGNDQTSAEDCELRSASLRGMLRWWWRAMHAGTMSLAKLRELEKSIWGATESGGAVRVGVTPAGDSRKPPQLYDKEEVARQASLISPPDRKTTQGVRYASFGMDDISHGQRKQRWYLPPGRQWDIRLVARPGFYPVKADSPNLKAEDLLKQARMALNLLLTFGAIGSKSRKGFGSFRLVQQDVPAAEILKEARQAAAEFRRKVGIDSQFQTKWLASPSIEQMLGPLEMELPWVDPWFALDQVHYAAQDFAKAKKHQKEKMGLGLPHELKHGASGHFNHPIGDNNKPVTRYASPAQYHFSKRESGFHLRVVCFPSPHLHSLEANRKLHEDLLQFIKANIENRCAQYRSKGQRTAEVRVAVAGSAHGLPPSGQKVEAVLVERKEKAGGKFTWFASLPDGSAIGPITNSNEVPADAEPDRRVTLTVHSPDQPSYRWPDPRRDTPKNTDKGKSKGKGGPGGRR